MELEAKAEETSMLRYPYTLFHSTMPDKTAHMYGKIRMKEGEIVMLKILFQGDSLTDCGRDKTGHNPVQAYGYGYVNLIASKLLCDYPDTVVWNKAYNGSRIADTYSRWIEEALNIDCNILSILSGVNDIGFAIRMNQGADAKKFKFIYELMINEALEKNKDLKLVLGEPFLFKITNNTPELRS